MAHVEFPPKLVRDLMSVGVITCSPETPIQEIAKGIYQQGLEEVVVIEERHNVGVVGRTELVQVYSREDWSNLTAQDILRPRVETVPADIPIQTAAQIMLDRNVRVLYITHHAGGVEYPAAYISFQHLLRHMAAQNQAELNDLGIEAKRQSPMDSFIQRRDATRKKLTKF
jgi:predicted transcriptional regulator